MLKCQFCNKNCKNENSLRNHERMCPVNPDDSYRKKFTTKGRVGWNKGLTKETNASVAKYAKALTKEKPMWQLEVDDDGKLYQRFANKRINAEAEGLKCELTFKEYCSLVKNANLVSSQLGFTGDGYVLARYNDSGNYTYGNCRFILQSENAKEKKISDLSRIKSSENIRRYNNLKNNQS